MCKRTSEYYLLSTVNSGDMFGDYQHVAGQNDL